MYPSAREMVEMALPMPVYIAAGVGLTTCKRVWYSPCQFRYILFAHGMIRGIISPLADRLGT